MLARLSARFTMWRPELQFKDAHLLKFVKTLATISCLIFDLYLVRLYPVLHKWFLEIDIDLHGMVY